MKRVNHAPVITCEEAAQARGIDLGQEVKTLLLKSGHRLLAAHIRGSGKLCRHSVRAVLKRRDLRFLRADELDEHGVAPGRINPWNIPFCTLNLISLHLLDKNPVGTNLGSLTEGILFSPRLLLDLPSAVVGLFDF